MSKLHTHFGSMAHYVGWILVFSLLTIPLVMWYQMSPMLIRFGSKYAAFVSVGELTGLAGGVLFAISLILSGRFAFTEPLFGGMNKVYIAHHIIGGVAFMLLLVHPLILIVPRAMISFNKAALFLVPGQNFSDTLGILALLSLMILLILTYYVNLKYHIWKSTHKLLGVAFFFGFLHAFFTVSDISRNMPLRLYVLGLCAVALVVYLYRTVFGMWLVKKHVYSVVAATPLSNDIVSIRLAPTKTCMNCQAGQFVFLQFLGPNVPSEWHPFSLSAINDDSSIEVVVKKLGDYTKLIDVICPSMTVRVEGPYGRFYDSKIPTSQIWIAGGIGITPFLAMAKRLSTTTSVDLYYIVHSREEAVGYQTLIEVVRAHANFRLFVYDTTQAKSRITATMIQQTSGALQDRDIYICGPPPMMKSLTQQLKHLNVSGRRIHSEEFSMS